MTSRTAIWPMLVPFAVSGLAVAALATVVDSSALHSVGSRVVWALLPALGLLVAALVTVFAWRWHRLLNGHATLGAALASTALGLGANQILPARGGDLVRALQIARSSAVSAHFALSKLVLEKLLDLLAVAVLGLLTLAFVVTASDGTGVRQAGTITAALMFVIAIVALRLAGSGRLAKGLHAISLRIRLSSKIYRHVYRGAFHLERAAKARALTVPTLITVCLWFVVYPMTYFAIGAAINVPVTPTVAMVLVCAGALGLALPAAPSGLGTFHASIVSGYVLAGHPAADGLVLAITVHAVFFLGFGLAGVIAAAMISRQYIGAHSPGASP